MDKNIEWDSELNASLVNEWRNIVRQANSSTLLQFDRSCGSRKSVYNLLIFTDSSKIFYWLCGLSL